MKYIKVETFKNELRYAMYADFLIRSYFCDKTFKGFVTKKDFIDTLNKKGFTTRAVRNIWEKAISQNKFDPYFAYTSKDNTIIGIKAKAKTDILVRLDNAIIYDIKTITDFKLLSTVLIASRPSMVKKGDYKAMLKDNDLYVKKYRSRTLTTIGKGTGTNYKQTVCNRINKAIKKFKTFKKTNRYVKWGNYTAQISNIYSFANSFVFNKYYKPTSNIKTRGDSSGNYRVIKLTSENAEYIEDDFKTEFLPTNMYGEFYTSYWKANA